MGWIVGYEINFLILIYNLLFYFFIVLIVLLFLK